MTVDLSGTAGTQVFGRCTCLNSRGSSKSGLRSLLRLSLPIIVVLAVCLFPANQVLAQLSTAERPVSFSMSLRSDMQAVTMPSVDVEALLAEDEAERGKDIPMRFGYPFDVDYTLSNSGTWQTLPDGSRLWRLKIIAPGAMSINLIYDYYWLPEGATLHLYNEDRSFVLGAFTSQNNKDHGKMATSLMRGEVTIVEYWEPRNTVGHGIVNISRIVHGYRDLFAFAGKEADGFGSSGSCNNNVHCPEAADWQDQIRAAAMILTSGGFRLCSGSLVNNVREDQTPYFLTANHCLGGQSTWIIMFNYESPTCQNIDGPLWMTVQGTTTKATYSTSDFGLLLLNEQPPDSYLVYYNGWSAENIPSTSSVGIHHPSGDIKKISWDYDPATSTNYLQTSGTTHWRIGNWEDGTTEPGSSGSPLYDQNHRVTGQLHGGYASCSSITADWYGKFAMSWLGGGSPSNQLKHWLDPDNTGVLVLDGYDPFGGTSIAHDPLMDTRDTVSDYEVICTITSNTNLVLNELLLHHRQDSAAWQNELLVTTLNPDEYHGFIPAQSPGVVVDYYLTALDDNGVADTTDLFTFFVIDYGVTLTPSVDSLFGGVDDTLWYSMTVTNSGVYGDDYALSVSGNSWTTELFDASGTVPVSSSGTLFSDETFDFTVRVMVPSSLYGDFDLATITATSSADGSYWDAAVLKSISVGQPQTVPYSDLFPTDSFDGAKWVINLGATIDDRGISEPSEPYSMNLNGHPSGGDVLTSQAIDLRNESNIIVRYWYEQGGGGDSPETGDDMMLEYLDSNGVWQVLSTHLGSEPDMSIYEEVTLSLPGDAYHGTFAIRFSCSGTAGLFDDWFVDDVYVGSPPDYEVLLTPWYSSQYGPAADSVSYELTVHNRGALADDYNLWSAGGSWSVTFFDAGGTIPISSTGTILAGDSGTFIARVAIPGSAAIGEVDSSSVTVISQSDGLVMSSAVIVTTSAGLPGSFPWMEPFPDDTLVTMRWIINVGAEVSTSGLNPPSAPYSFNFDGGNDTAITQPIDLSGQTGAILAYHYQRGGGGSIPAAGDDLTIEYKNDVGVWVVVNVHAGSGPYMSEFEAVNVGLPGDAIYGGFQLRIHSVGDGVGVDDWFVDDIRLDFAPSISASPGALGVTLAPGDSSQSELVISNGGPGALIWQSSVIPELKYGSRSALFESLASAGKLAPAQREYRSEFYDYVDVKGADVPSGGFPTDKNGGGPDAFGYYWLDSDEPGGPTFSWVVPTGGAIDIVDSLSDDNYSGPYALGFSFDYYGVVYDQIFIGSNGIIGFSSTDMASRFKTSIPSSSTPNNMLAWLWDDLNPDDADNPGAHVYIDTSGGRCIVSFIDYPEYSALPGEVVTAQVILEPNGLIRYQYLSIASGFDIASCAVGIENGDGTDGLEVAFATSYLHDALAVEFYPPANWISADLSSGELASGESDTVTISFNATDLEDGTYMADIIIVSNDPDSSDNPLVVPAQLIVSTGPDVTPPQISNVAVEMFGIATDSVRISWSTDEPASSQVEYGLTVSYGSSTTLDTTLLFSHGQVINGLLAGELYHFRVKSVDAATNEATGSDSTFTIPILCGDAGNNGSGPDVSDLTYLVDYLFNEGPTPEIPVAADMDGSGGIDVADVTYLVDYLFRQGPPPICNG